MSKKKKKLSIIALFALTATFGIILVVRYSFEARTYGVVVGRPAQLLSGPGKTFQTLQQLPKAQELIINKESGEYYKVKALRRVGWVHKKGIEKV